MLLTCHLKQPILAVVWLHDGLWGSGCLIESLGPCVKAEALAVGEVVRTAVRVDSPGE